MFQEVLSNKGIEYEENISLKDYSSFKVGGVADLIIFPKDILELKEILQQEKNVFILGNGSNIVFADKQFKMPIVSLKKMNAFNFDGKILEVYSGLTIKDFINNCVQKNIGGFEKIAGIPGTIGGAIYMNAGAHGFEFSDRIVKVKAINKEDGTLKEFDNAGFSYRKSQFNSAEKNYIILSVELSFDEGVSKKDIEEYLKIRGEKQPLNFPSVGSFFKRPAPLADGTPVYAAKIIEDCGLKGFSVGDAAVSEKHAGFVVNKGKATYEDIIKLRDEVIKRVHEKTGVTLETEPEFYG
jgi:UDP-N-acetylmuramate dehydrogenase